MNRAFIAIIEPGTEGFGVYFPDLPGCTSAGETMTDAASNASKALALHIKGMIEDGAEIPAAAEMEKVEVPKGSVPLLVEAITPGKLERVNITMDEGTLTLADRLAKERGVSRSGFFAELVRQQLANAAAMKMPPADLAAAKKGVTKGMRIARLSGTGMMPAAGHVAGRKATGIARRAKD